MAVPASTPGDPGVALRGVALQAAEQAPALGREIWARAVETLPETAAWEPSLLESGPLAAEANIRELAALLRTAPQLGEMHAPALALAHARHFAREGVPFTALLRIYHLGHELWRDFYVVALGAHTSSTEELVAAAGIASSVTFAYLHAATDEVVTVYEQERLRVEQSGERARRETVDALLAGDAVSPATAIARLGLDLRRSHTALVAWSEAPVDGEDPVPALERLLRRAAAVAGVERPLVVAPGWTTAFAWLTRIPGPEDPPLQRVLAAAGLTTGGIGLACGCEAPGIEGFRASHREALAARTFAAPGEHDTGVVTYDAVELASLLTEDHDRARAFTRRELGGLAATDEATVRLRATLAAYLAAASSATRTAERLGVHKNTVIYRVRHAEQARGTPLEHRRLELEAALRLAGALPELLED